MSEFCDGWWQSGDGLRLHYRDYPGAGDDARPPVLCLPGLTRNARDFATLAARLAAPQGGGWRVLCPELRGRGLSGYAPDAMTYTPLHYVQDVLALLDQAGISRVVAIGTSLGGLMTMGMGMLCPQRLAGAVLNDVGPVLEPQGLAKIASYVGLDPHFSGWDEGAEALRATYGANFPRWRRADWLAMAHRVLVAEGDGTLRFDYDPRIAVPFLAGPAEPLPDLWPGLEALGKGPLLLLRGALSDILSAETLAEMTRRAPGAEAVTLPDIGHPLTLDEPEAVAAILRLLGSVR